MKSAHDRLQNLKSDFLIAQYKALREEAIENKKREFYCLGFHGVILPAIFKFITESDGDRAPEVLLVIPFITVGASILFTAAWTANFRIGTYVKETYETLFRKYEFEAAQEPFPYWEHWLDTKSRQCRVADITFLASSYLSFAIYYLGFTYLAIKLVDLDNDNYENLVIAAYVLVGIFTPWLNYFKVFRPFNRLVNKGTPEDNPD